MKKCDCGFVLIGFIGVAYNEYACFKCGHTEEFFNSCEKIEDKKLEKEAMKLKKEFYDKYKWEREKDGITTKSLSQTQFKEALKEFGMLK